VPRLTDLLFKLNSAELALLSFLLASLLGAGALMITESGRSVADPYPVHKPVRIQTLETGDTRDQTHTHVAFETRQGIDPVDAWFVATSAICVTGLSTANFAKFTIEGQVVVLILMQAGGLGIFVFTSILVVSVFRGAERSTTFRERLASMVTSDRNDATKMLKYIIIYTAVIELGCFLILGTYLSSFDQDPGLAGHNPWWWAAFHAISAFNNAGFSLNPDNLVGFVHDPVVNLAITSSIILGGIGYPVLVAAVIRTRRRFSSEPLHPRHFSGVAPACQIKVTLYGTAALLLIGMVLVYWLELENLTGTEHGPSKDLMAAWFQSVTTRTAGFNSMDIGALHAPTLFLFMILMFIGGNPAGTAGGIKIPTVAVLIGFLVDWFRKPGEPVYLFGKPVSKFAVSHAVRLFFFASVFVVLMTATINYMEREWVRTADPVFSFTKILFEVVSAFSTTGLSMGFPDDDASFSALFSDTSKLLLIVTMLFGRIGPLVLLAALPWKRRYSGYPLSPDVPYAEKVQIG